MALAQELTLGGTPPAHLQTTVDVGFEAAEGITGIKLNVRGRVPGLTSAQFAAIAATAKESCPVARALSGTTITIEAALDPAQRL